MGLARMPAFGALDRYPAPLGHAQDARAGIVPRRI
jgi:hypothetical protein